MTATLAVGRDRPTRVPSSNLPPVALVAIVALAWNFWRVASPSLWRDEFFTAYIAGAGPDGIYHVANRLMDRIHVAYYMVMWAWTSAFGTSEVSLRAPSVIAMAAAATALFLLARRYTTVTGSLIAAAIFLVVPSTTQYAQEARSYAFVVAGVVVATLLMHAAAERGGWKWWAGYAAALVFAATFSFIALLVLVAHAVFLWRRTTLRTAAAVWAPSVLIGGAIAAWSSQQSKQVSWIPEPTLAQLGTGFVRLAGTAPAALLFVTPVVVLAAWSVTSRRWRDFGWMLVAAALPVALWLVSHVEPMFIPRYVLWVVPVYALIAAIVTTRFHPMLGLAFLVVLAYLTFPQQMQVRSAAGHGDDFRGAQQMIADQARPGDAITFDTEPGRMGFQYYDSQEPAAVADPLEGPPNWGFMPVNKACTAQGLAGATRVWEVQLANSKIGSCGTNLRVVSSTKFGNVTVNLFG